MKTLVSLFFGLMLPAAGLWAANDVFMPSADCYPDPVLDSITVEKGHVYVEDHVATSGEVSYIMHKVNPALYERRKSGQRMYLLALGGGFAGLAATCTGYSWVKDFEGGMRGKLGKVALAAGIPLTAASVFMFTKGVSKANKAERQFLHDCLGLDRITQIDVKVGAGSVGVVAHW